MQKFRKEMTRGITKRFAVVKVSREISLIASGIVGARTVLAKTIDANR
jgi:hypothetical protein